MIGIKYLRLMILSAKNGQAEKFNSAASLLSSIALFLVLFSIYSTAYSGKAAGGLLSLNTAMWSLGVYSLFWASGVRSLYLDVQSEVQTGAIETRMTLPVSYPMLKICERLGKGAWIGVLHFTTLVFLFTFLVGQPEVGEFTTRILYFGPMFLVGLAIASCLFVIIGLSSIWLYDSKPLFWLIDKTGMILGGAYVPLVILPTIIQSIASWLPPGAMFSSTRVFAGNFLSGAAELLFREVMVAAVCVGLLALVWRQAQRKINVNGG